MPDHFNEERFRLFAFTQADGRQRYLEVLRAFDEAREQSRLQLSAADMIGSVEGLETVENGLSVLDQLHAWGVLDRMHDDRRVRTIAEYRQRHSVYQMTELGWLAWDAVENVLAAEPGEAELRRLVLPMVLEALDDLSAAVDAADGERVAALLGRVHTTLTELAHHAARFTLATSELASAWEADPNAFLEHKNRLLGHLNGFLVALSAHRPLLRAAVSELEGRRAALVELATEGSAALDGRDKAELRAHRHWQGVVVWFVDVPGRPSQAALLEERTNRAIRDLAVLLKRVLDATAGGVSRATQLDLLASFFTSCPDDASAHALAAATSGLLGARHFGVPAADLDATEAHESWWQAPPAPVDTRLRKWGRASGHPPPSPVADRSREGRLLRQRQVDRREVEAKASCTLVEALELGRPLENPELEVLLRLLSRALQSRQAAVGTARSVRGRLRIRLVPAARATEVATVRGKLLVEGHRLEVSESRAVG